MSDQLRNLLEQAEAARVKSGELNCLIEFINEAEMERDISGGCPSFINNRTLGTVRVAMELLADVLNSMNEDLADGLELYIENHTQQPAKRGAK